MFVIFWHILLHLTGRLRTDSVSEIMEEQRTKRDRVYRAARRVHGELQEFMDHGHYLELNVHTITNRGTEFTALAARILTYIEALEDEPEA